MNNLTITKIAAHITLESIGDGTAADLKGYHDYLREKLKTEYCGADIEINDTATTYSVRVEVDNEENYIDALMAVQQFTEECWTDCPWSWVKP